MSHSGGDPSYEQGADGAPLDVNWRDRVKEVFNTRRQTPAQQKAAQKKVMKRSEALLPISIPTLVAPPRLNVSQAELIRSLRTVGHDSQRSNDQQHNEEESKEQADSALSASSLPAAAASSSSPRRVRTGSSSPTRQGTKKTPGGMRILRPASRGPQRNLIEDVNSTKETKDPQQYLNYSIPPPAADTLYKTERSELEKLPLELFDNEELYGDLTAEQWVALGQVKYHGKGTPAKSSFYNNKEYAWMPCRVLEYDPETQDFLIEFQSEPKLKKVVKRLSILFDDEDPDKFYRRLEACRKLREEALAQRRYNSFLDAQATGLYAPIQQSALHGIVGKLMMNSEELVMSKQKSVENLLIEVREDYGLSMKYAIVDYKRHFLGETEESKLRHLQLPPKTSIKLAP